MPVVAKSITKDTVIQLLGRGASAVLTLIFTLFVARHLDSFDFGEFTKIIAFITLFYMGIDFGLNPVYLRLTNSDSSTNLNTLLGMRLLIAVGLSVLAVVVMFVLSHVGQGFDQTSLVGVAIATLSLFGYALTLTYQVGFQAQLRFWPQVLSQIIGNLVALMVVILVFWLGQGFLLYSSILATSLGVVVTGVAGWLWFRKLSSAVAKVSLPWRTLLIHSWPLGATLVLNVIYFRLDILVLAFYRGNLEVGVYGLAYRFFELILVLPTFIMNSWYPRLLLEKTKSMIEKNLILIWITFLGLGICAGVLAWIGAPLIVYVRSDYASSIELLRILSISLPLFFLTSPLMWLYVLNQKQKQLLYIYLAGLVVNVIGNLMLIPTYGGVGAAWMTGVTELVVLLMGLFFYSKS